MGNVRVRKESNRLFFDFRYKGIRCREQTTLIDSTANRKRMESILKQLEAEITLGTFKYRHYFPNSSMLEKIPEEKPPAETSREGYVESPLFGEFSNEWFSENVIRWKKSYRGMVQVNLTNYLIPNFGKKRVSHITKSDILKFRSSLAKVQNGNKEGLSPDRINHIMTTLRMILNDAADRYDFTTTFIGIKQLKVRQTDVDPFSLEEIKIFLEHIRPDFRNYYETRFFNGMRTSEIDGLKWKYVDFNRKEILVRETLVKGEEDTTKTMSSTRTVAMSAIVYRALKRQYNKTGHLNGFVFCTRKGTPLNYDNVSKRIWYPTLKEAGLKKRRPYQTRHTAATLWLAAGESPEWIARQMGHSTTKMLFTVYSRYVPNLTRNDGSAFEKLLASKMEGYHE